MSAPQRRPIWGGTVTSWEPRVRFGRHLPIPWEKLYAARADTQEQAHAILSRQLKRDGYGFGGLKGLCRLPEGTPLS